MPLFGDNCYLSVICRLKGKTCRTLANGQDIDYYEEK